MTYNFLPTVIKWNKHWFLASIISFSYNARFNQQLRQINGWHNLLPSITGQLTRGVRVTLVLSYRTTPPRRPFKNHPHCTAINQAGFNFILNKQARTGRAGGGRGLSAGDSDMQGLTKPRSHMLDTVDIGQGLIGQYACVKGLRSEKGREILF